MVVRRIRIVVMAGVRIMVMGRVRIVVGRRIGVVMVAGVRIMVVFRNVVMMVGRFRVMVMAGRGAGGIHGLADSRCIFIRVGRFLTGHGLTGAEQHRTEDHKGERLFHNYFL